MATYQVVWRKGDSATEIPSTILSTPKFDEAKAEALKYTWGITHIYRNGKCRWVVLCDGTLLYLGKDGDSICKRKALKIQVEEEIKQGKRKTFRGLPWNNC